MELQDSYLASHLLDEIDGFVNDAKYPHVVAEASSIFGTLNVKNFLYFYLEGKPTDAEFVSVFGNVDTGFISEYRSNKLHRVDPVLYRSSHSYEPFFWDSSLAKTESQKRFFAYLHENGFSEGFSIPIHSPGIAFGVVTLLSEHFDSNFSSAIKHNNFLIWLLGFVFHNKMLAQNHTPSNPQLSKREVECLEWIAEGKTYEETGLILGIKERTVKYHAENIRRKLGSGNMRQALIRALGHNPESVRPAPRNASNLLNCMAI